MFESQWPCAGMFACCSNVLVELGGLEGIVGARASPLAQKVASRKHVTRLRLDSTPRLLLQANKSTTPQYSGIFSELSFYTSNCEGSGLSLSPVTSIKHVQPSPWLLLFLQRFLVSSARSWELVGISRHFSTALWRAKALSALPYPGFIGEYYFLSSA